MSGGTSIPVLDVPSPKAASAKTIARALGLFVGGRIEVAAVEPRLAEEQRASAEIVHARPPYDDGVAINFLRAAWFDRSRRVGAGDIASLARSIDAELRRQGRDATWRLLFQPGYETDEPPIVAVAVSATEDVAGDLVLEEQLQVLVNRHLGGAARHVVVMVADAGP